MSDNVDITPGLGATIAADEVADESLGSVKVQYVKLMSGELDSTSKVAASAYGLNVDMGTQLGYINDSVTTYAVGNSYQYISTATTTVVKNAAGFLARINVTGGTAGTIILYNALSATGNPIASFDSTNAIASYPFDISFDTGLTIVTGAATKLTVVYR